MAFCPLEVLKNKDDLLRAVEAAKELGMEEYKDYFLIYDACRTEYNKSELAIRLPTFV